MAWFVEQTDMTMVPVAEAKVISDMIKHFGDNAIVVIRMMRIGSVNGVKVDGNVYYWLPLV